ncbi:hypothetical protein, partial [Cyclobacterium plantarum]|uniref:hypothetical protein n=1 Tax=Cyclobacterium plantarum TaxID=2716263 RepID=UPI003F714D19
ADNSLETAITAETERAETAEATIIADLITETEERKTADLTLGTALTTETAERKSADITLATALDTETTERTTSDATLETAIATETVRAQAAEAEKEDLSNKSIDISTDGESDIKYTSAKAVKDYVDVQLNPVLIKAAAIIGGGGLNADGTYKPNIDGTYIASASSLSQADDLLDIHIKENADDIEAINTTTTNLRTEIQTIKGASGFDADGSYLASSSANYISGVSSLSQADQVLDAIIKENKDLINSKAPLASPTLMGTPTAPTAEAGTNTTQIATTAFVTAAASASNFMDLTSNQTVSGTKSFQSNILVNGITVGGSSGMFGGDATNTLFGFAATTGEYSEESAAIGYRASATGPQSIALGSNAQANQTQGLSIGYYSSIGSGYGFAIGSYSKSNAMYSVALGPFTTTEGNYAIALGYQSKASGENSIAIGKEASVTTDNTIQLGNIDVTNVNTNGSYTGSGFKTPSGTSSQFLKADGTVDATSYAPEASPTFTGTVTVPTLVVGTNTFPTGNGSNNQVLTTDGAGTLAWQDAAVMREVADEFSATTAQTNFTLTQTPSVNSKVKMYVNGIRISNTAYSVSGAALTYTAANNGNYSLTTGDRVQFDYYY